MEEDKNQAEMPEKPAKPDKERRAKPMGKVIAAIIIVLLLALIGWLAWQWRLCLDHDAKTDAEKKQLQTQIDDLKKQLDDAKKPGGTSANTQTTPCTNTAPQSLKDNIAAAINSKNTAALQGYMASSVTVVIAASEKGDTETPAEATVTVEYTHGGTAPWNFNLPAATITSYKAGFYKQYFPDGAYVGKAANDQVVSFGFDCNGKINMIFMAASADLLTS